MGQPFESLSFSVLVTHEDSAARFLTHDVRQMMAEQEAFRSALQSLSRFFDGGADLDETLLSISQLAVEAIPGVDHAGMSLWDGETVSTHAFTDRLAVEVDQAQYRSGAGPCLLAFREQCVVSVDNLAEENRWPEFVKASLDHGLQSTLALPLRTNGTKLGALNLFSNSTEAFGPDSVDTATVFAGTASVVLANTKAYMEAAKLSKDLTQAMKSRAVIEQAKGILMARGGHSPDEAFRVLTIASQRSNRKVRDIATELVESTPKAHPERPPEFTA